MAGNTDFPASADVFSANTPTPTTTTTDTADSTGRKHAERHDDAEAALMAIESYVLSGGGTAYTQDIGAVTGGSPITVTHNLGTFDVAVQIVEKGSAGAGAAAGTVVDATVSLTTTNSLTVTFTNSAAANLYRITVIAVGGILVAGESDQIILGMQVFSGGI